MNSSSFESSRKAIPTPAESLEKLRQVVSVPGLTEMLVDRKMQMLLPVEVHNLRCAIEVARDEIHARVKARCFPDEPETQIYEDELATFIDRHTDETFAAAWADPNLSRHDNTMRFKQLGRLRFVELLLEKGAAESELSCEERLRTSGCLFFDGTALKSIITAAGTQVGSDYLKIAAKLFNDPSSATASWFRSTHPDFTFQAYSAGGDEFILFFESLTPLPDATLQEMIERYQQEISESPELRALVNLDNPEIIMRYHDVPEEEKALIRSMSSEDRAARLDPLRRKLPPKFTPHFSGGYALLEDAIEALMHHDASQVRSSEEAWDQLWKIADELLLVADERQRENKRRYKEHLRQNDADQWFFMIRSPEAERYARELHEAQERIARLDAEMALLPDLAVRERLRALLVGAPDESTQ